MYATHPTIAALLILKNAIIHLYVSMKSVPRTKIRNSVMLGSLFWILICDYNGTIVAHDTHKIRP